MSLSLVFLLSLSLCLCCCLSICALSSTVSLSLCISLFYRLFITFFFSDCLRQTRCSSLWGCVRETEHQTAHKLRLGRNSAMGKERTRRGVVHQQVRVYVCVISSGFRVSLTCSRHIILDLTFFFFGSLTSGIISGPRHRSRSCGQS